MNKTEYDILVDINNHGYKNQRLIAKRLGLSLGMINKSISYLLNEGYLCSDYKITDETRNLINKRKPKNAIILAAGFGIRMIPINSVDPKGLIQVRNEVLIERIIKQLNEVDIYDIAIVVGFMKERFEYLIDKYNVQLIVNDQYNIRNNLYSLRLAVDLINNTYIIPSDIWSSSNPFNRSELYSWYMVTDKPDEKSEVKVNRKMELVKIHRNETGNQMIGISYITDDCSEELKSKIIQYSENEQYDNVFWEEALFEQDRMMLKCNVNDSKNITEINTLEDLRELENDSNHLHSDAINIITKCFGCKDNDVNDIRLMKKGMTNRSFIFQLKNSRYVIKVSDDKNNIIDFQKEADVYNTIADNGLCDNPIYFDSKDGFIITKYIENSRCCNPNVREDVVRCMKKLKYFHNKKLKVNHFFDFYETINKYESLWNEKSIYNDYIETKQKVYELKEFIDSCKKEYSLAHIDSIPDNFIFDSNTKGDLSVQLIDWEYSGMQDPHVDIAMFSIYCLYDKKQIDNLIDIYFEDEKCDISTRTKIYCYVATSGLLWSNWCEYKRQMGIEFGEYSLKQYRYAKEYYRYAKEMMKGIAK